MDLEPGVIDAVSDSALAKLLDPQQTRGQFLYQNARFALHFLGFIAINYQLHL